VGDAVLRAACEVETAYYALAAAQQVAAMRRRILAATGASVDLARRQRDAGDISDLDLASQEALAEQVRTDVARSEADVIVAREVLTRWLGAWDMRLSLRISEKLPELPADDATEGDLESIAVVTRLDLGAAREEGEAAERAYSLAKTFRWLGGTSVGATYDKSPEGFTTVGPNVGLELPLFDQKQAVVARLAARVRATRARRVALEVSVRSEVRVAQSRVALGRALVVRYANVVVPLRERVVALSEQHYSAMLLGTAQLLQAKQSEVNAYRELIEVLRDYWIARADLERATGGARPTTLSTMSKTP
jgi:cobalt-zinc-cadmium efflux system outer membrane protein